MVHYGRLKQKHLKSRPQKVTISDTRESLGVTGYRPTLVLFVVLFLMMFSPRIIEQGALSFEIARSLVWDGDIQFENERSRWTLLHLDQSSLPIESHTTVSGYVPNPSGFGAPLTILPVLLLVRAIEFIAAPFLQTGADHCLIPSTAALFYSLVTVLLGALSLIFMIKTCLFFGSSFSAQIAVMIVTLSSSFLTTTFIAPGYVETTGLFWMSLCMFLILSRYFHPAENSKRQLFLLGFSLGMAICTEWSLVSMIILGLFLTGRSTTFSRSIREFQIVLILFFLGVILGASPQLIANKVLYGQYVHYSIGGDVRTFIWSIFHPRLGLIFQFPVIIFCISGIISILRHDKRLSFILLFLVLINCLLSGLKFDSGQPDFGHRHLVMVLPVLAIGLTFFLDRLVKKGTISDIQTLILGLLLILWTLSQLVVSLGLGNEAIQSMDTFVFLKILFVDFFHHLQALISSSFFYQALSPVTGGGLVFVLFNCVLALAFIGLLFGLEHAAVKGRLALIAGMLGSLTVLTVVLIDLLMLAGSMSSSKYYYTSVSCPENPLQLELRMATPWSSFEAGRNWLDISAKDTTLFRFDVPPRQTSLLGYPVAFTSASASCGQTGPQMIDPPLKVRELQFVVSSPPEMANRAGNYFGHVTISLNSDAPDSQVFSLAGPATPGGSRVTLAPLRKAPGRCLVSIPLDEPLELKTISFTISDDHPDHRHSFRIYGLSLIPA